MSLPTLFPQRQLVDGCFYWCKSRDGDVDGFSLARRHYSAWKNPAPKQRQFVPPGFKLVLISLGGDAVFAWRYSQFDRADGQSGVCCTIFRNESPASSSAMIEEADEIAWAKWPGRRLFTFVDGSRIESANPGYCFKCAGWRHVRTADGRPATTQREQLIFEKLPSWKVVA